MNSNVSKISCKQGFAHLRSVAMQGIGAVPALYPALQACGMTKRRARGFTLIELLVVVLIIGILAAVAVPQYRVAVEKSRASTMLPILKSVLMAQQVYFAANGVYASKFEDLDIEMPAGGTFNQAGNKITYPDGRWYDFWVSPELESSSVRGGTDANDSYLLEFYNDGTKFCYAKKEEVNANKVCRSFGTQNGENSGGTYIKYNLSH